MTALLITIAVFSVILLLLFLPVCADIDFNEGFSVIISIGGIKLNDQKSNKKNSENKDPKKQKNDEKKSGFFVRLKSKLGFAGAVKAIFKFLSLCVKRLKAVLGHTKFKKIVLNITVASDNAAQTAIEYGAVCGAVYPFLSLLDSFSAVQLKRIDLKTDFNATKPKLAASLKIKLRLIFLLVAAFTVFSEYKQFKTRYEL